MQNCTIKVVDARSHLWIESTKKLVGETNLIEDYDLILSELIDFKNDGGICCTDCTLYKCGRNGIILKKLSQQSKINIVATTGFHKRQYYPVKSELWILNQNEVEDFFISEIQEYLKECKETGKEILDQVEAKLSGEKITGRIVSYYQDHSRTLPKGKLSKPCEFGVKLKLDMSGNGYITNHDICKGNVSDVSMLSGSVASHARVFGSKFKRGAADRRFYDEDLIEDLKKKYKISLAIPRKKDRTRQVTPKDKKLSKKRSAIEAKISEGKRMCGLDRSLYNVFIGDRIWAALSVMALNIRKLLRDMERSPELIYRFG